MRVAVIGGGVAGLAAAWELGAQAEVTVFEPGRLGGKIHTTDFDGRPVDEGPDAFVTRAPGAIELCASLGLSDELVAPAAGRTLLWGDRLRPLPEGLTLGVPRQLRPIARSGLLSPWGLARAAMDLVLPTSPTGADVSVEELIGRRFGHQVAKRLVEPLVGGIHAAAIGELSAATTVPQILAAARRSRSLLRALRRLPASGSDGPIFLTPEGGLGRLPERLHHDLVSGGAAIRPVAATSVRPTADGRVVVDGELFDRAILAVPATHAVRLLDQDAPAELAAMESTSVDVVTLSFADHELPVPAGVNGILVPPGRGRLITALSFGSNKWPQWSRPGRVVLRVSTGRRGDDRSEQLSDEQLATRVVEEVNAALGSNAVPGAWRVSRWPGGLPLYRVGHLERVECAVRALAEAAPGIALAGASYRGAGIPACITTGRPAARRVLIAAGQTA